MENNEEITDAIPYNGIEEGIEAIVIEEKSGYQQNKPSKIIYIVIGLVVIACIFFLGIEKHLENVKREREIQDSIVALNDLMKAAETAAAQLAAEEAATKATAIESEKQTCYFNQLSKLFDYELKILPTSDNTISFLELNIIDKSNKSVLKSLNIKTESSLDCIARSYITGFNKDEEIADGDYGFFIVQDFNFDGLEDIAVKRNFNNSGAYYSFYLQTENHDYISDIFLTDSIGHFPELDFNKQTLNLAIIVGVNNMRERNYQYDKSTGWKLQSDTLKEIGN